MKKIKFESKLTLKKETVARLSEEKMNHLKGGAFTIRNCPTSIQQSLCNGMTCP
jgi:natural product precursor